MGFSAKNHAELEAHLAACNKQLEGHEHLQFLAIVKDDWLPENGFLTPTQKIKRATIERDQTGSFGEGMSERRDFRSAILSYKEGFDPGWGRANTCNLRGRW